jgi:hypothetical protein
VAQNYREPIGKLYESWRAWAERTGVYVGTKNRLSSALEGHGFVKWRTKVARGLQGLRIATGWVTEMTQDSVLGRSRARPRANGGNRITRHFCHPACSQRDSVASAGTPAQRAPELGVVLAWSLCR